MAVQAVDGTKVSSSASVNRSYDAAGLRGLLERLERAIADLDAQNEAGEDAAVTRLPEELADKKVLRERGGWRWPTSPVRNAIVESI